MNNRFKNSYPGTFGRIVRGISFATIGALLMAGCASDDQEEAEATSDESFVLYSSLGLSGSSQDLAPSLAAGIEAAAETINDDGGLLGREVVVEVANNESDPTTAVSNLQRRMQEEPRPDLVWAGSTSSETLAMLNVSTDEEIIALNNGSAPEVGDASMFPYSFSAGVGNEAQADFLVEELQERGHTNVGVLTSAGAFGEAVAAQYKETFEAAGMTVSTEQYEADAVEMDGPLARLNDKDPDVIVFNNFTNPAQVLRSRERAGLSDIPFIGDISTTNNDMSDLVSDAEKENVLLMSYQVQTTETDRVGVENLFAQLDAADVTPQGGLYLYALAYDTVLAYANAVEEAQTTETEAVKEAMEAQEGGTYELAITDDIGWTDEVHIGTGAGGDLFTLIPVTPIVDGQFQLDE